MTGSSIKHTYQITFVFLFLFSSMVSADSPVNAEDVNTLAEMTRLTTDSFMQQSFQVRMSYEFNGEFPTPDDRDTLQKIAQRASSHLQAIADDQQRLKNKIEDYQGNDWDERYGLTGLWRKLSNDLYVTNLSKCEIGYYLALTVEQSPLNKIIMDVREQIISLDTAQRSATSQLLRAKILALARIDSAWNILAMDILGSLVAQPNVHDAIYFRAAIERFKLFTPTLVKPELLNSLADKLAQSSCANDIELSLSLAFLQRRLNQPETLERTVKLFPQTEDILGSLILSELSSQKQLQQVSIFEAELAVQTAWRDETKDHREVLGRLSKLEKFQTPLILYVTAVKFADSSPANAVGLLIEASKLQKVQKSDALDVKSGEIAEQAAKLAYNLFVQDSGYCATVLKAFENYSAIAGDKIDEELEYIYSVILDNCGEAEKTEELLEKIADRPAGNWHNKARLELTVRAVQQKQYENPKQRSKLLGQFSSLITGNNDCKYTDEAMELLSAVIEEIDKTQQQVDDFDRIAQDCKTLAEFCFGCLDGPAKQQAGLFLAEAAIFAANKEKEKLSAVEKLLNDIAKNGNDDVNLLRCRARLLTEQGNYDEAAELWGRICEIRKSHTSSANQRSWKWWRAKFYELACWSKCPTTKKENVLHTIEILENSFEDIPPLWAEKLNLLKGQIK